MQIKKPTILFIGFLFLYGAFMLCSCNLKIMPAGSRGLSGMKALKSGFGDPPDSARPGVYWYFMDGYLSSEGITKDLESMKAAGIGSVLFLEVNVGVPRGPVDFLSDQWYELFRHAVDECKRLGISMTLGIGPGWTGSGGPWISADESMQDLVSSTIEVSGPAYNPIKLEIPGPRDPFFGKRSLSVKLKDEWKDFYKDVAVLAFPTPLSNDRIKDVDEKALYLRAPFSSARGVKPIIYSSADDSIISVVASVPKTSVVDITKYLQPNGELHWKVPPGKWTIKRFVSRNNGAITRPAPVQGLGFESDKFDTAAINHHLDNYVGVIFRKIGPPDKTSKGGIKLLHIDSWEMGSQNWTLHFRQEFIQRRGYDPLPFYPVYDGNIIESQEVSERFLWDLRQTCQELILDDHIRQIKNYSHKYGLSLSIEPYDMNPTSDLELGVAGDIPMGEFWSKGFGYNTSYSCIEASSVAHIQGQPIVQGEAFTSEATEAWKQYPEVMKNQGDWAFATGINRLFYHTFQHKSLADSLRPGMTMGHYGVHWDRKQTWWPMVASYHQYISRCQFILQQGKPIADVLYLTAEEAPQVFLPPPSALAGNDTIPDRRGYNFDGCPPSQLYHARVINNQIVFPGGASYRLLVLPVISKMTPMLLEKIRLLIKEGAIVVGIPPNQSPSLTDFPNSDTKIQHVAAKIWGKRSNTSLQLPHRYGKGKVIWSEETDAGNKSLYPSYEFTAGILKKMSLPEDFESMGPVRYTHRIIKDNDFYFVSNKTKEKIKTECKFRTTRGVPELWDPVTGECRPLPQFSVKNGQTIVYLEFYSFQSFFIVFSKRKFESSFYGTNFPSIKAVETIEGPWQVSFDPKWGGPEKIIFNHLTDWINRGEDGIKYYSGMAVYKKTFDFIESEENFKNEQWYLDLGKVNNLARVKLNGYDLGVLWTAPWKVNITGLIKPAGNQLVIEVANLWPNRLIGDKQSDEKNKEGKNKFTSTTNNPYKRGSPLLASGLIGPVTIESWRF